MAAPSVIEADCTWSGFEFRSGIQIQTDDGGRIVRTGDLGLVPTRRLPGMALLPGFVNAHSHAFQRGLRGLGERFPEGAGSFWTWRDAMYNLVTSVDRDRLHRLSLQAFREMRRSGITTVGEFHYLHHEGEDADWGFDDVVIAAAREAGIRLALLHTFYRTGGIWKPLGPAQRRFRTDSSDEYWAQADRLADRLDGEHASLGIVAHSLRAAEPDEISALQAEAQRRGLVFHIHVEEQPQEVEDCLAAYGRRPLALLNELFGSSRNVTAVHCTHAEPADLDRFLEAGGSVCLCPLTEANLGDGIPKLEGVLRSGGRLCLGSDSNARIAMLEEMRWLEYGQRLSSGRRGLFRPDDGYVARMLLGIATEGGASALGVDAGRIAPGAFADFAAIDLSAPALDGVSQDTLLDALVFGAGPAVIAGTCVGGAWDFPAGPA